MPMNIWPVFIPVRKHNDLIRVRNLLGMIIAIQQPENIITTIFHFAVLKYRYDAGSRNLPIKTFNREKNRKDLYP